MYGASQLKPGGAHKKTLNEQLERNVQRHIQGNVHRNFQRTFQGTSSGTSNGVPSDTSDIKSFIDNWEEIGEKPNTLAYSSPGEGGRKGRDSRDGEEQLTSKWTPFLALFSRCTRVTCSWGQFCHAPSLCRDLLTSSEVIRQSVSSSPPSRQGRSNKPADSRLFCQAICSVAPENSSTTLTSSRIGCGLCSPCCSAWHSSVCRPRCTTHAQADGRQCRIDTTRRRSSIGGAGLALLIGWRRRARRGLTASSRGACSCERTILSFSSCPTLVRLSVGPEIEADHTLLPPDISTSTQVYCTASFHCSTSNSSSSSQRLVHRDALTMHDFRLT